MKKFFRNILVLTGSFYIQSCSTDVDLNANWKENMVIYGLLDQSKSTQYINITKAYLGEGDALEMAKRGDSIYYNPTDLTVTLEELKGSTTTVLSTEVLTPASVYNKESGIFNSDSAALYKAVKKLNSANTYKLTVVNNKTGYTATATTPLVKANTTPGVPTFNIYVSELDSSFSFVQTNGQYVNNVSLRWFSSENGKIYQPIIRFYYIEADDVNFTNAQSKYADFYLPLVRLTENQLPGERLETTFAGDEFYTLLKAKIPADGKIRRAGKLDFILNVGGEELDLYAQISKPSNGIAQEKPTYTNITNGYGLFSCRYQSPSFKLNLSNSSLDKLINGEITSALGFRP